jgi:carboxypeptidase C (cathepsin A)
MEMTMPAEDNKEEKREKGDEEPKRTPPQDRLVQTHHSVMIGGQQIGYTVATGVIVLKEESEKKGEKEGESEGEKPRASIFFTAYVKDGVTDAGERPITFCFNGGPGSSSVWLHLGAFGPRRVKLTDEGDLPAPPFRLVDNEFSLLDVTDLVFIDPVSTGYSRPVEGEKAKEFHGFKKDLESVGDFIRLYTTRYRRWLSPKFVAGESYGTTRASALAAYLQERHGFYLNGIMLVSAVLEFATLEFHPGNELPPILFLPTYAATAWYHKRLAPELQADLRATLREVEQFALGEYASALFRDAQLSAEERQAIAARVARYTGLSADHVMRSNLRVIDSRFFKELLREQRRTVGRLDSRFVGIDRDAAGEGIEYDRSYANIQGPYTACLYDYVRGELGFESDLPYEIINEKVWPWSYKEHENQYVNVAESLRKAMTLNPHLRVFIANGYYDLATPYFATEYTVNRLQLDETLQDHVSLRYYEAGHMMYIHLASLARLKGDLAEFVRNADGIEG